MMASDMARVRVRPTYVGTTTTSHKMAAILRKLVDLGISYIFDVMVN